MELSVPSQVAEIIELLNERMYEAYLVGDCVRGLIKNERPLDFDIITDADMSRLLAIFEDRFKTNTDYVEKGELIIINGAMGISVSPYRARIASDGKPVYGSNVTDDLRRRAFRANAVAYSLTDGIFDPFGGFDDLTGNNVVLTAIWSKEPAPGKLVQKGKKTMEIVKKRTVFPVFENNPEAMLEAVRRYSTEGVEIAPDTIQNICENPQLIFRVDNEAFHSNFKNIILGKRVTDTLMLFKEVFFAIIPKLAETYGYDQRSAFQEYTLYEHIARSVGYAVPDFTVRMGLLFHGIGKPDCAADVGDFNSYSGHGERGAMLTRRIMEELGFSAELIRETCFLVYHHDDNINERNYTSFTAEYGTENARYMALLRAADLRAKNSDYEYEQKSAEMRFVADEIGRIGNEYTRKNSVTLADLKKLTESLGL